MDPPLINESSFSAANPSAYSLAEIWPFGEEPDNGNGGGGLGLRVCKTGQTLGVLGESSGNRNGSMEESTVTEQSGGGGRKRRDVSSEDETYKIFSTSSDNDLKNSSSKKMKLPASKDDVEGSSVVGNKPSEQSIKPDPPKDYIHVRARRGQATDSHSLAERARREKISERMKILQDLVPGCNKVIGKAVVLDEIINYIESLQRQVEFLSMKLEVVNSSTSMSPTIESFPTKDPGMQPFEASVLLFGSQRPSEYVQVSQPEWLHMQVGTFERPT